MFALALSQNGAVLGDRGPLTSEKPKSAAINPQYALLARVNKSLNFGMSWITIPLLLAAAAPLHKPVTGQTHAVATVQIVAGEEIRFEDMRKANPQATQRQKRVREGMPMVEFY